jgi:hypothetical protein
VKDDLKEKFIPALMFNMCLHKNEKNTVHCKDVVINNTIYGKPFRDDKVKRVLFKKLMKTFDQLPLRARKRGFDFDLDREWVANRLSVGLCEATGIPFQNVKRLRPTFDRMNNKLGYTKRNTWLVCWHYNRAKGEDTIWEMQELAEAIYKNQHACIKALFGDYGPPKFG